MTEKYLSASTRADLRAAHAGNGYGDPGAAERHTAPRVDAIVKVGRDLRRITRPTPTPSAPLTATDRQQHLAWRGRKSDYQRAAQETYLADSAMAFTPWSWIRTTCETPMCLQVQCMVVHAPVKIAYPAGICVYCGDPSGSRDHLLPRAWSGEGAARAAVAVVPACASCNSTIRDTFAPSILERRYVAHARIEKRHATLLNQADRTDEEMGEFGYVMRTVIEKNIIKRAWLRGRLAWPADPEYDLRAFQRSGIDDPVRLGLI